MKNTKAVSRDSFVSGKNDKRNSEKFFSREPLILIDMLVFKMIKWFQGKTQSEMTQDFGLT